MNKLDLEETTRRFHDIYEQVAKEYGYKTRKDPKELDFNSPNGMTMLKTVETITTPYLEEIERLKEREKKLQESFSDWKKGIEKERKYWLCERTNCCGRIKDSKKYSSLYQENKRLNNIINELEKYINETKLEEFEKEYGRRYGKTFTQAEVIICNMILNKLEELKGSESDE